MHPLLIRVLCPDVTISPWVCVMKLPLTLWPCVLMCVNANLLTFGPKVAFTALLTLCTDVTYIYYLTLYPDGTITDAGFVP